MSLMNSHLINLVVYRWVKKGKQHIPCARMTFNQQLVLWVKGQSIHNGETPESGQCCPDFSCCIPSLKWDLPSRLAFLEGSDEVRERLLLNGPHASCWFTGEKP